MEDLKVGDLCITQRSRGGLINDGALVWIVAIDPQQLGEANPYVIRRMNGEPFGAVIAADGTIDFCKAMIAHCSREKLRRLDRGRPEDLDLVCRILLEESERKRQGAQKMTETAETAG